MQADVRVTEDVRATVFAPSPVVTVTIEAVGDDDATEVHFHAGGQGIWVARMMHQLGATVTLCTVLGGETGTVLQALIEREGLELRHVPSESWNGAYVHDRRTGELEVITETSAAPLSRHDLDALYSATLAAAIDDGTCVLTGTSHEVVPADTYRRLAHDLGHNGVEVVADLSGPPLAAALEGGVGLVKLSHEEVIDDGFSSDPGSDALVDAIGKLRAAGAHDVVISRSGEPALACLDGRLLEAETPELEVVEPRGAGDAMTATLAVGRARRQPPDQMLRLAVAAGSLNTTRHGLATGDRKDVERLASDVKVRPFETAAYPNGACP